MNRSYTTVALGLSALLLSACNQEADIAADPTIVAESQTRFTAAIDRPSGVQSDDYVVDAGILNNEVPADLKLEALAPQSQAKLEDYAGLWSGTYTDIGGGRFGEMPLTVQLSVTNGAMTAWATTPFVEQAEGRDITFEDNVLTFAFESKLFDQQGNAFPQFADLVLIGDQMKGLVRLRMDDREQFDMDVKHTVEMTRMAD